MGAPKEPAVTSPNPNPYRRSLLRRERSLDTRRKLVRAAARLWSEKGYDATTVEEICAAAGVGRTTYYLHFESKEQLLLELTHATARGVAGDVDDAVGAGTLDDQLRTFVRRPRSPHGERAEEPGCAHHAARGRGCDPSQAGDGECHTV